MSHSPLDRMATRVHLRADEYTVPVAALIQAPPYPGRNRREWGVHAWRWPVAARVRCFRCTCVRPPVGVMVLRRQTTAREVCGTCLVLYAAAEAERLLAVRA